ncbi:MAG: sporulation protein YqfD, partial [Clostridia bacterium]|nr:sporulation protein YqfD [Clostridia bacterium]
MNGPLRFLMGSYRVFFCAPAPETLLNATHRARIPVWGIRREGDTLSFSVSASDRDRVTAMVPDDKKEALSLREEGSLILRRRFGKRTGLILGLTLFLALSFLSTLFVWSVEVEGNVLLSDRELRQRLAEVGVTSGRLLSGIDTAEVALQLRVNHSDLAHASLNLIGTRAVLSVREREPVPREEAPEGETANLVADVGGRILRYEVLSGKAMITRGEEVQKGALLVSGVLERPNGAFTTVRASGRVFAQTERCFEVTVPLEQTATVFTGREREAS